MDIGFNTVAEGVREAGLGQQVVAPGDGLVEVSGLGPATSGTLAVRPGFFVQAGGEAAFAEASSPFRPNIAWTIMPSGLSGKVKCGISKMYLGVE